MEIGIQDIRTLIELLDASTVGELTYEQGTTRLVLKKGPGVAPVAHAPARAAVPVPALPPVEAIPAAEPAAPEPTPTALYVQKAPMVGTFYAAQAPEAPPYVQVGDRVQAGQILCIIEAMKLMNEIEAEHSGIVRAIRVKNAEPVDFGQPLFELEVD